MAAVAVAVKPGAGRGGGGAGGIGGMGGGGAGKSASTRWRLRQRRYGRRRWREYRCWWQGRWGQRGGTSGSTKASAGCSKGTARPASGSVSTSSYYLTFPESYDGKAPVPVLIGFHGCGSENRGTGIESNTEYVRQTRGTPFETGYVVAVPISKSTGGCWTYSDDMPRIKAMYDDMVANYCVDQSHVFATGHSSGAEPDRSRSRTRATPRTRSTSVSKASHPWRVRSPDHRRADRGHVHPGHHGQGAQQLRRRERRAAFHQRQYVHEHVRGVPRGDGLQEQVQPGGRGSRLQAL